MIGVVASIAQQHAGFIVELAADLTSLLYVVLSNLLCYLDVVYMGIVDGLEAL